MLFVHAAQNGAARTTQLRHHHSLHLKLEHALLKSDSPLVPRMLPQDTQFRTNLLKHVYMERLIHTLTQNYKFCLRLLLQLMKRQLIKWTNLAQLEAQLETLLQLHQILHCI